MNRYNDIIDNIKLVDIDLIKDWEVLKKTQVIEKQKVFFWIRLYLKEEDDKIQIGDDVIIKYNLSGEQLTTKFIYFGKNGLSLDHDNEIINYEGEDDKKILCLLVDESFINDDIPFIRKMFKTSIHYEYQLLKREDIAFINKRTGQNIEYYDCDF